MPKKKKVKKTKKPKKSKISSKTKSVLKPVDKKNLVTSSDEKPEIKKIKKQANRKTNL